MSYLEETWIITTLLNRRLIAYVFLSIVTPDWPWALHLPSLIVRLLLCQLINRLSLLRPGQIILCNIYYSQDKGRTKIKRRAVHQRGNYRACAQSRTALSIGGLQFDDEKKIFKDRLTPVLNACSSIGDIHNNFTQKLSVYMLMHKFDSLACIIPDVNVDMKV